MEHTLTRFKKNFLRLVPCSHVFSVTCFLFIGTSYSQELYADSNEICNSLINIVNSPSHADSPCSVPYKNVLIELTYAALQLPANAGSQQNFPNAQIRIGLPANNEFLIIPPNYSYQKSIPGSGFTNPIFSLKHAIPYNKKWLFALETLIATPGGSDAYGSLNGE